MTAMPMYRKNLKNLLQNQLIDGLETWGVALSNQVLQKYLNFDIEPFYANFKFGAMVFVWEKVKIILGNCCSPRSQRWLKHSTK